jgi:hypothetical protein
MSGASLPSSPPAPTTTLTSDATDERRQLAARVLTDALLLGAVGDALLRAGALGANMAVWSLAIVAALFTLARRRHDAVPSDARWLAIPAIALSLMFAWRDAESLAVFNTLALIGTFALLAVAVARGSHAEVFGSRVRDVIQHVVEVGFGVVFGMLALVLSDVSLRQVAQARGAARAIVWLRAALIALPLLLVFGGLFASADPVFARIMGNVFRIDGEVVASHLIVGGIIAWFVGGFLRTSVLTSGRTTWSDRLPDGALGLTEVSVALGSLVLLFAAFVGVQLRYFFGGDGLVQATAGMSYADYARRGFFELVTVSALVLPLLLTANALLRRDTPQADRVFRGLASALLALLAVIMYSALARMRLYQSVYGMSEDRLYATVFMGWLAVVFVWFATTVLRNRGRRFVAGALVSGWATLLALNVANPGAMVARANVARAAQGKELDVSYLRSLGAEAAPALAGYLVRSPLAPPPEWAAQAADSTLPRNSAVERDGFTARCEAARHLLDNWGPDATTDWRSWTLGRARARRAVAAHERVLRTLASRGPVAVTKYTPCPTAPAPLSR